MLRNIARLSFKRTIHTGASPAASATLARRRLALAGATAVSAAYLTWRITSESNKIALDSADSPKRPTSTARASALADEASEPAPASPNLPLEPSDEQGAVPEQGEEGDEPASQGAFDPVTGKINWDCPCLGGMAYGPCGMQFREAFSCFVFSEAEPKGIDCVEKFKAMQDCFRANPDVYGDEIMNDDDDEDDAPASLPPTEEQPSPVVPIPEPVALKPSFGASTSTS